MGSGMANLITYREAVAADRPGDAARPDRRLPRRGHRRRRGRVQDGRRLFAEFGLERVWDTSISEQAIVGAAMGAAMTGMRLVAEIMFFDFLACCWDYVANEILKMRYMIMGRSSSYWSSAPPTAAASASAPSTPRRSRTGPSPSPASRSPPPRPCPTWSG